MAGVGAVPDHWPRVIGASAGVSRTFCHAPLYSTILTDRSQSRRGWDLQLRMGFADRPVLVPEYRLGWVVTAVTVRTTLLMYSRR